MKRHVVKILSLISIICIGITSAFGSENSVNQQDSIAFIKEVRAFLKKYPTNHDSIQKALSISKEANNKYLIATCKRYLAGYHISFDQYDKAIEELKSSAELYLAVKDSSNYAGSLSNLSIMYHYKGDYSKAIETDLKALSTFAGLSNKKKRDNGLMYTHANIGIAFLHMSDYSKAYVHMNKSLDFALQIQDSALISSAYHNIGELYEKIGDYENSLQYLYKSIRIDEALEDNYGIAMSMLTIGSIHNKMKEHDLALEYYKKSLEISVMRNKESEIATANNYISESYSSQGDYENALIFAQKSLKINQKIGFKEGIAQTYSSMSDIYIGLNDYDTAIQCNNRALKLMKELGRKRDVGLCHIRYGKIYMKLKNYSKSKEQLLLGLQIANETDTKKEKLESFKLLSNVYSKLNNYKEAHKYQNQFIDLNRELFQEEKLKNISAMQTRFDVENKENEIKTLKKEQEVKDLELVKSKIEIENQKTIRNFSILLFIVLIFITFLVFNRYKLKQKEAKLELEKQHAETENRLLRSQMNPHFIFNSLYSIQGFLANNESRLAEDYLFYFASLMRSILNNSSQSFITLDKELESLQLYMKLEQLRYGNKLKYKVEIDENVEQEFIKVPPMLIQPFVENSIQHGIFPKSEAGTISISIEERENSIFCRIIDDGIGREESMKRKKTQFKNHQSLALEITQNRLDLIGDELGVETSLDIFDLKDESGNPLGTKVEVVIPIMEA